MNQQNPPTRDYLLSHVFVFQLKLAVDSISDVFLSSISLIAALAGTLTNHPDPSRYFNQLLLMTLSGKQNLLCAASLKKALSCRSCGARQRNQRAIRLKKMIGSFPPLQEGNTLVVIFCYVTQPYPIV